MSKQHTITDLITTYPRTVAAIDKWLGPCPGDGDENAVHWAREYARRHGYADYYVASLPRLMATIEAHLNAEATPPISDEEITQMWWLHTGTAVGPDGMCVFSTCGDSQSERACKAHNADLARLGAEIRRQREEIQRLRLQCGKAKP